MVNRQRIFSDNWIFNNFAEGGYAFNIRINFHHFFMIYDQLIRKILLRGIHMKTAFKDLEIQFKFQTAPSFHNGHSNGIATSNKRGGNQPSESGNAFKLLRGIVVILFDKNNVSKTKDYISERSLLTGSELQMQPSVHLSNANYHHNAWNTAS